MDLLDAIQMRVAKHWYEYFTRENREARTEFGAYDFNIELDNTNEGWGTIVMNEMAGDWDVTIFAIVEDGEIAFMSYYRDQQGFTVPN